MIVRRVKPIDRDAASVLGDWESVLADWPRQCASKREQKARRQWRKRAVDLAIEHGGVPKAVRPRVWALVLEAVRPLAPRV